MKNLMYLLTTMFVIACSTERRIDYPYTFINQKTENGTNTMELYTVPAALNIDTLKMFCLNKKGTISSGTFHYLVFFDAKENAVFPNNPITALYGLDEEPQKHIKAYYIYNRLNGFSELNVYESNSWESKADVIKL